MAPSLLSLPLELRWKILRSCMVIGIAQVPSPKTGEPFRIGEPEASSQLLRVCKQLYAEAFPILYQENIMYCRNVTYLESFVTQRAPSTRAVIRHICIAGRNHYRLQAQFDTYMPFFQSLPELRSLNTFLTRISDVTSGDRCFIMATARTTRLSAPSQSFIQILAQGPKPINLGVIKCEIHPLSKHSILETDLDGEALIRYRIVLPTRDMNIPSGSALGLQVVFASQGSDWTSFLPKTRGAELGKDNPVTWFGRDWQHVSTIDELALAHKSPWLVRNPFGAVKAINA